LLFSGSSFDIKDFHSVVLSNGPMPLTTLETVVDNWIQQVKQQKQQTTPKPSRPFKNNTNASWIIHPSLFVYIIASSVLIAFRFIRD
jgi:hypothetical protein